MDVKGKILYCENGEMDLLFRLVRNVYGLAKHDMESNTYESFVSLTVEEFEKIARLYNRLKIGQESNI